MEARFSLRVPCKSGLPIGQYQKEFRPLSERPPQFARRTTRPARICDRNLALSVIARAKMSSGEQVVRFRNEHDEELVGWLRDAGTMDNLVIFCHGYMSNATHCHFQRLTAALYEHGTSSFRFDHAMAIDSPSQRTRPFVSGNYVEEAREIQAAVKAMEDRGYRIACLVGHSKGGFNVFLCGATFVFPPPRIVSISGRYKMADGVFSRYGPDIMERLLAQGGSIHKKEANGFEWDLTYEDLKQRLDLDVPGLASKWPAQTELVLIHGTADATIPFQEAEWVSTLIPQARTVFLEGADHNYTRHAEVLQETVISEVLRQ